jgi:hypothetical protein
MIGSMEWRRRGGVMRLLAAAGNLAVVAVFSGLVAAGPAPSAVHARPASCVLDLLGQCVLPTHASSGVASCTIPGPGDGCLLGPVSTATPTPTPGSICVPGQGSVCLPCPGGSCPSVTPTPTPTPTNSPSPTPAPARTTSQSSSSELSSSTSRSNAGGAGLTATQGPGATGPGGDSSGAPTLLNIAAIPVVRPIGVVPGLNFGNASVVIAVFVALDLVALLGLMIVLRRSRGTSVSD